MRGSSRARRDAGLIRRTLGRAGSGATTPRPRDAGFSLVELMLVIGLVGVLAGMAVLQAAASRPVLKADGAMRVLLGQIRIARELAVTQRRYIRVTFTAPNVVTIIREEVPGPATTTITATAIEGGVDFRLPPTEVPDTPDRFGRRAAVDFGTVTNIKFSPDGTLVDQDGQTTNGTVFLGIAAAGASPRAVTVLGATGRIHGYRWNGRQWNLV